MSTVHVFVSYSHRDDTWVKEGTHGLIPWLAQQLKKNEVEIWYDHALKHLPGAEYRKLIKSEIDRAHLAILLISQDFVSSDFIREFELPWIRQRVERGELSLIPILVGSTLDEDLGWLADRQMIPGKPAPLIEYTESTAKWQAVRLEILGAIRDRAREIAARRPIEPSTNAAEAPEAIPTEVDRAAEKALAEHPEQPHVGTIWEEEARVPATKLSQWLAHVGVVGGKKRLAAAIGLGLLGVLGIIILAVTVRTRPEPAAGPPVAATSAGTPVATTPAGTTPAGTATPAQRRLGQPPPEQRPSRLPARDRRRRSSLRRRTRRTTKRTTPLAMKLYKPLANQGNSKAQFWVGYMYLCGEGVAQDYQQSRLLAPQGGRSGLSGRHQ